MTSQTYDSGKQRKVHNISLLESHNWLIHLYYTRKEFKICKELISRELEKSKNMGMYPNLMQGIILRQEGKMQESLDYFQACQTYNPGHIENLKQIAKSWLLAGRHEAAIDTYAEIERALKKSDWEICHNLGLCWYYMKDMEKAKSYFLQASQLSNHSQSYIMLKNIFLQQNNVNGAIEAFKIPSEASKESYVINLSLGLLYTQCGQLLQAFEKIGSTLAHDSTSPQALLAAGYIMQDDVNTKKSAERNDLNVALAKYRTAAHYVPESAALWNNIGMCFLKKQKFVSAVCCLKRANYLSPFDSKILYNLGFVHIILKQYASAFHFLSAWLQFSPYRVQAYTLLAATLCCCCHVTLHHLGDWENAEIAMKQACQLDSKDPLIPLNFAILKFNGNQNPQSISCQLQDFEERARIAQESGQTIEDEVKITLNLCFLF
ncbi:hypothetical protein B566_EDAN013287 [Ephemera danica]|nr:hypothetical protein B566_EDAN013287 [Ephemera danica]